MTQATYTPAQVAKMLDVKEMKLRRIVREECAQAVPDALRFVPGGRVHGNIMRIHRGIFDATTGLQAPATVTPVAGLHRRKAA